MSDQKIDKEMLAEVQKEFPDDPALQEVHLARKILAKEAKKTGLSYFDYLKKLSDELKTTQSVKSSYESRAD